MNHGIYLVCKDNLTEVSEFLSQFFERIENEYTHASWVTFKSSDSAFLVNLMSGSDQKQTKNITFEIYCDSLKSLQKLTEGHGSEIQNFTSTKSKQRYQYYYTEIQGPNQICKIEASYSENL
tara:strand:+ start:4456 stop:4821 length:366 start_codon:yes stop_codon:yes gene_type:complete